MKNGFRQAMSWLHTWAGLLVGWVLYLMFLTGTLGYVASDIDRWMKPEAPLRPPIPSPAAMTAMAERRLLAVAAGADTWKIEFPRRGQSSDWTNDLSITWEPGAEEIIDLRTGAPMPRAAAPPLRKTAGGRTLYRMHYRFLYMPRSVSDWIAGVCTMFMFVACVTGVIVHKKIFADFFTFRPRKGQRSWLDLHNLMAVTALPFHLMITYTGLVFISYVYVAPIISASYSADEVKQRIFVDQMFDTTMTESAAARLTVEPAGVAAPLAPLAPLLATAERQWGTRRIDGLDVHHPGDANARVYIRVSPDTSPSRQSEGLLFDGVSGELLGHDAVPSRSVSKTVADMSMAVHEGLFAGPVLRCLYFLSGLLGTVMVGAGLVLWTVKRRQKLEKKGDTLPRGLKLVDRLNVATIVGLPVAIAAYFWANRLIPVTMEGRAVWEVHSMVIVWVVLLLHAALRSQLHAWIEQCAIATGAYILLPVLNAITTDRHLGVTVPAGDWALAAVDFAMLGAGLFFAGLGYGIRCRPLAPTASPARRRAATPVVAVRG